MGQDDSHKNIDPRDASSRDEELGVVLPVSRKRPRDQLMPLI